MEKSSSAYSDDDLINAYLKGVEAGKNENNRVRLTELKNNISQAAQIAEDLLKEAEGKKIKLKGIHLKADNISNYTALFVANMNDFVSDDFRAIYTLARRIQNESEKENFYISFSFMPYSKSLSEHCLISDGFFMKYEKK